MTHREESMRHVNELDFQCELGTIKRPSTASDSLD